MFDHGDFRRLCLLGVAVGCVLAGGCVTPSPPATTETSRAETPQAVPAAPAAARQPRVMLVVDEQSLGTIATAEIESMAVSKLIERNVPVVDQEMVRANLGKGQQLLKGAGDNRGAAALGTQFGADIVIAGEAVAKPSARRIAESNLRAYQAVVTLRAVRTDNSATIASSSEDASIIGLDDVSGSSKALKAAGQKCLDALLPRMLNTWAREPAGSAGDQGTVRLTLTIGGVDQAWKLKAIRDELRGMTTLIRDVTQRSFTTGLAEFDLDSLKPAEELAEALVLKPPQGLKFQLLDVGAGKINLRAAAAQ
jgi:hypothetical protein